MYDIHCHLIYGLDSTASYIGDSLKLCRAASSYGVRGIIATPHYMEGMDTDMISGIQSKVKLLNDVLKGEGLDIEVFTGMEVNGDADVPQLYERGKVKTLNNKKYMLIEFPGNKSIPFNIKNMIFNLELIGIRPIIAHPERCGIIAKDPDIILDFIDRDCIIQVDSGSIEGLYGREVQKAAWTLLRRNMVHVIASNNSLKCDGITLFKKSHESVLKKMGEGQAHVLFFKNPYRIINGQDIFVGEPRP